MVQLTLLSPFNREIAFTHGEKIFKNNLSSYYRHCSIPAPKTVSLPNASQSSTWYGKIWSWINPKALGEALGWGVGMTHGQEITNQLVEVVARRVFRDEITKTQSTGWSWFNRGVVQPAIIEATKISFTPLVQPFVLAGLSFVGGVAFSAAFAGISALYAYYKNKKVQDLKLHDIYDLSALIKVRENALYIGEERFEAKELKDIMTRTYEYALCQELLTLESSQVDHFIDRHISWRSAGLKIPPVRILSDGYLLTTEQVDEIATTRFYLHNQNPAKEKKAIVATLHLFAEHTAQQAVEQILEPKGPFIKCSDGRTCARLPEVDTCLLISEKKAVAADKIDAEQAEVIKEKTAVVRTWNSYQKALEKGYDVKR